MHRQAQAAAGVGSVRGGRTRRDAYRGLFVRIGVVAATFGFIAWMVMEPLFR